MCPICLHIWNNRPDRAAQFIANHVIVQHPEESKGYFGQHAQEYDELYNSWYTLPNSAQYFYKDGAGYEVYDSTGITLLNKALGFDYDDHDVKRIERKLIEANKTLYTYRY